MAASVVVFPEPVASGDKHHTARLQRELLQHRRQVELFEARHMRDDLAQRDRDGPTLPVDVDPVTADVGSTVREVDLVRVAEVADLLLAHERRRVVLGVFGRTHRLVQHNQFAIDPDDRWAAHLQVKVGSVGRLDLC